MPLTKQELESKLWQAADILRGQIDAADYKNYIFSILFLKRLSDRFDEEVEAAVASGVPRRVALSDLDEHEFFVPEPARWKAITAASMNLGEVLNVQSHNIESANTPRLDGVLAGTNWNDETKLGSPATASASSGACSTTSAPSTCATTTWEMAKADRATSWVTPTST